MVSAVGLMWHGQARAVIFTNLHAFAGRSANSFHTLLLSGDRLYGTANSDGGWVFAVNTDGTHFTNLMIFDGGVYNPYFVLTNEVGLNPNGSLVLSSNTLYGTTQNGAINGQGAVFALNTDGSGFHNLHVFSATNGFGTNSDGAHPGAGLIISGDDTLYGVASTGGTNVGLIIGTDPVSYIGAGTVFSVKTSGADFINLHNFAYGGEPAGRLVQSGNSLYGTTVHGTTNTYLGSVFVANTDLTFANLYDIKGSDNGYYPVAGLVLSDNRLYGTTFYPRGTVFSVGINGSGFTNLWQFTGGTDGAQPLCDLLLAGNVLYGTTSTNGYFGYGTVFAINTDGTGFTNLWHFTGGSDGGTPYAGLVMSGNTLYGTTTTGGSNAGGIFALTLACPTINLFALSQTNLAYRSNYSQTITASGGYGPYTFVVSSNTLPGGLILSPGSKGVPPGTIVGTPTNVGRFAFAVTATDFYGCSGSNTYTLNVSLCQTITLGGLAVTNLDVGVPYSQTLTATGGAAPYFFYMIGGSRPPGLNLSPDGVLSGIPTNIGTFNFSVMAMDTNGCSGTNSYSLVVDLLPVSSFYCFVHYASGAYPTSLILSGNSLYGTTANGGSSGAGTVFRVNTDGTGYTNLHEFNYDDGQWPYGVIVSGNTLFGTTYYGATPGNGTLFALGTNGLGFTNLYRFSATSGSSGTNSDGAHPNAGLVLSNATLYGTTYGGGPSGNGTVFGINTNGTGFTNLHSFSALTLPCAGWSGTNGDGVNPYAGLVFSSGALYGTTSGGGPSAYGTIFALQTDGSGFTNVHNFTDSQTDGAFPYAGLVTSGNTLYGTTYLGGNPGYGTVFAINTDGSGFTLLHSFSAYSGSPATNSDGALPGASGLVLSGSTLYGIAAWGGLRGKGTIFALGTNGADFTTLHSFTGGSDGIGPNGVLLISGNTLYGSSYQAGCAGYGTIFSLTLRTPAPPRIRFDRAPGRIVLIWPTNAAGLGLQAVSDLTSANWSNVTSGISVVSTNYVFTNAASGPATFFRLSR